MLNENIKILVNLLLTKDIQGFIIEIAEKGLNSYLEYSCFRDAIDDFLGNQKDELLRGQLEEIIKELRPDIKSQISNKELDFSKTLEIQVGEKFKSFQIPDEQRNVLKELFKCYILDCIQQIDRYYYNDLVLRLENIEQNERLSEMEQELDSLVRVVRRLHKSYNNDSPIKMSSAPLHIDNSNKMVCRDEEIGKIYRYLMYSNVIFLYGRPGIGKSTLAKMYAHAKYPFGAFFLTYKKSIEYTVGRLTKEETVDSGKKVLDYWEKIAGTEPTLLIIDNFNEDRLQGNDRKSFREELNGEFFQALLKAGIKIIFTTRINVGDNVLEISSVNDPYKLFENYYGRKIDEEKDLVNEIIEVLRKNTLLIILAAHVLERCNSMEEKEEILRKLKNCNLNAISTEITSYVRNSNDEEVETMYQQARALLDMSGILNDKVAQKTFANMVLLPLNGMSKKEFLELTCSENDNELMRLVNGSWVLVNSDRIYLHPVVREVACEKNIVSYALCDEYCRNIKDKIAIGKKFEERLQYKEYAQEIFDIFSSNEEQNVELLRLYYDLSDIYDELSEREKSMKLMEVIQRNIDVFKEDLLEKACVLSGIAYSLNNYCESMEALQQAEDILNRALECLNSLPEELYSSFEYTKVKGKVLSNLGSNYLAKSKCNQIQKVVLLEKALEWHNQALAFRLNRYDRLIPMSEEARQQDGAIATSYTTIATDYFYLEEYKEAIQNHQKALERREKLGNEKGMSINQQRIIGCVLKMYKEKLFIEERYILLVLGYYPYLVQINKRHQNIESLKNNMNYWIQLICIVMNDRRYRGCKKEAKEKSRELLEWICSDMKLKKILENEIKEIRNYIKIR